MSELTRCNYCSLRAMKERAEARGVTVIVGHEDGWTTARYSDEEEPAAYFLTLSGRCEC